MNRLLIFIVCSASIITSDKKDESDKTNPRNITQKIREVDTQIKEEKRK